jgi:antitoxin HigA-1
MKTTTEAPALRMHNPPHPGEVLQALCLAPLELSVTDAAAELGVARKTLSAILNGHAGISAAMAMRLAQRFKTTPESWLQQQMQWDLWQARKHRPRPRSCTGDRRLLAAKRKHPPRRRVARARS